jgi:hypothetical protein
MSVYCHCDYGACTATLVVRQSGATVELVIPTDWLTLYLDDGSKRAPFHLCPEHARPLLEKHAR